MTVIKSDVAKERVMNTKRLWMTVAVVALAMSVGVGELAAQGSGQVYTDEATFLAALDQPDTYDFENPPFPMASANIFDTLGEVDGIRFDGRIGFAVNPPPPSGSQFMRGDDPCCYTGPGYIYFDGKLTLPGGLPDGVGFKIGFGAVANPAPYTRVRIYGSFEQQVHEEFIAHSAPAGTFFGYINSATEILWVEFVGVDAVGGTPVAQQFGIDDFSVGDVGQGSGPDLIVDSLTHQPANPTTEDDIEFTAVVRNIGDTTADDSTLSFKIGGESPTNPNALFNVPPLAPGASATFERVLALGVAQNYQNTAVADFNNDVAESNESNNTTIDIYTVTEPDEPPVFAAQTYIVTSLPLNGVLKDSAGTQITAVPYSLPDPNVMYEPATGFTGVDKFKWQIDKGGLLSNLADGFITVGGASCALCDNLTIDFQGNGQGSVRPTPEPQGKIVVCAKDCTLPFGPGTMVKLQARPADGMNTFVQWGGACASAGSSAQAEVTLGGDKTCTATFSSP